MMKRLMKLLAGAGLAVAFAGGTMAADLTIAVTPGDNPSGGVRDLAKVFGEMKGVEIELVQAPYDNLFEKAFNAAQTKSGIYDILLYDDTWGPPFFENDFFEPLAPYYQRIKGTDGPDSDFIANAVALTRDPWGTGPIKAIPLVGNAQMFFYHPAAFAEAGLTKAPPFTWEEFIVAAKKITDAGGGRKFGYVVRGQQGDPVVSNFLPHLWAFGGEFFDKDGNPMLDTPQALEALEFYLRLRDISPPGVEAFDSDEMATYLLQGAALASVNWPNWASDYENPDSSRVVGQMAYTVLPHGTAIGQAYIGMWLLSIYRDSKNKDLAFEFIDWVTEGEQQTYAADKYDIPPTRLSVFNDPELLAQERFKSWPALLQNIIYSHPAPRHKRWFEVLNSVGVFLSEAVAGVKTPKEALDASQKALLEINAKG